jgi:hypothetical protein
MASASGPAGRPTPSLIRGRRGVSSSDRAAGERHDNQRPAATTTPTETTTMITARAVSTTTDWSLPASGVTRLPREFDYETAGCGRTLWRRRCTDMSDQGPELPRSQWQARLQELTQQYQGHGVAIELLDQEFGDEAEVEMLPLAFLEFDPKDDVVIVAVGGRDGRYPVVLRHIVEHPQGILADSVGEDRVALDIVDGDGNHTIVTIQAPTPA